MDKEKRGIGSLLGILRYLLRYRLAVAFILFTAVAGNILALQVPKFTGGMVDALTAWDGDVPGQLARGALSILLVSLVAWALSAAQNRVMLSVAQRMVMRLRHDVFARLMRLPVSYFDTRSKGDIISVVGVDIDNVSDTVSSDAVTLISGAVTVAGALAMMLALSPRLTLIFAFTAPMMALYARYISKRARARHRDRKNCFGRLCGYAEEMITAQKTIKAYGLEDYNETGYRALTAELRAKGAKAEFTSSCMMPVMNGINNLNFTLICLFGGLLALEGGLTVGGISAFILYSRRFSMPIIDTANIINMFQTSLAACDRIFAVLRAEAEPDDSPSPYQPHKRSLLTEDEIHALTGPPQRGAIRFENVRFAYRPDVAVLDGIDIDIPPGQRVAVVGATGSGKTTLVSLLLRFYAVSGGRITLDGQDIAAMPLRDLRRSFALVLQDSWLFEGSVYENIAYAAPPRRATPEMIRRMSEEIQIDDFISGLPDGYDTVLHNDSGGLSQGQKQLINIARAFLCDPPVFILDEATSSVDTLIEAQIQHVTERVIQGKTSIIIAHRLSTVLRADRILVMQDGLIRESGTHTQLLAQGGLYKGLYESQFKV